MKRLATIAVSAAICLSATAFAAGEPSSAYFGTWKVLRIIGAASTSWSPEQGRRVVGTTFVWADHNFTLLDGACAPKRTEISIVDTESILEKEFDSRKSDLNIDQNLLGKTVTYIDSGCAYAIAISKDEIIVPSGNGYTYLATRVAR